MSEQAQQPDMTPGLVSWNELATNDLAGSKQFYTQLFGWTVQDMPMSEGSYSFLKIGDRPVGGMMQMPAEAKDASTMWMSYVTVANLQEAVQKATSLGAKLCKDVTPVPDMGSFAIISDPQGAILGLWEFAK
jgi:predicted enzyme related to lactoylglutathione lyase